MLSNSFLRFTPQLLRQSFFLHFSQYWSAARLGQYQDMMLKKLIRHAAAHVPYYRELFATHRIDPESFRGRVDMAKIPLLDKETLRTRRSEFVADNAEDYAPKWCRTSGSTGIPLQYMLDSGSLVNDVAATLRSYRWAGFIPGRKLLSVKFHMRKFEFHYNLGRRILQVDSNSISPLSVRRLWREINRLKPSVFRGYPFYLLMLYHYGAQAGIKMHRPRSIITTGESLPGFLRHRLESCYQSTVFDYYGMSENTSMITECEAHGYHVIEDYAFHEFLDLFGNPVSSGRSELVATSFYNYAMPLIRYRCDDFVDLALSTKGCRCGRSFRLVEKIEGRKDDYIVTPEGGKFNLIETALEVGRGIMMAQYVQDADDHLYVNIVPGSDFQKESLAEVEKLLRYLLGSGLRIDFKIVEKLEQRPGSSGKVPFIYSKIGRSLREAAGVGL